MTHTKASSFRAQLEAAAAGGAFGANGDVIVATLARVAELSDTQVERLASVQAVANVPPDMRFYLAWQAVHEETRLPDGPVTFQHVVSWSYSIADQRLKTLSPAIELSEAQRHDFRHAVAGRALTLMAGADLRSDYATALSAAWTTVIG